MDAARFKIIVSSDEGELGRYSVVPGEYTIGRSSVCSIPLGIGAVSHVHARVRVGAYGTVSIEDLCSENGTLVGDRVLNGSAEWPIGQIVRIGGATLELFTVRTGLPRDASAHPPNPALRREADQLNPGEPAPITPMDSVNHSASTPEVIRRHLPLADRKAQRLDVEKEVARGGMGAVLQARESATRRMVAMKVMLRTDDARSMLRFIEEAQITAQLEHPNIVPVHDLGIDERGQPFYTMKLVAGITLGKVLQLLKDGIPETVRKYPLATLLTVFQKICDALAFAHSRGVIHRDLKPANIMLGKFGEAMVMDWGLAKIIGTGKRTRARDELPSLESSVGGARREEADIFSTMAGSVMGTAHYMSPEQARGKIENLDASSDIFTLGVILYEILTLERPFTGRTTGEIMEKIIAGDFVPPGQRVEARARLETADKESADRAGGRPVLHLSNSRVPDALDAIVCKAMALDPAARYPSVQALQADLLAYQTGFATSAERKSASKQVKSRRRKPTAACLKARQAGWRICFTKCSEASVAHEATDTFLRSRR